MAKSKKYYRLSKDGTRIAKEIAGYNPGESGRNKSEDDKEVEAQYPQYFNRWQSAARFAFSYALSKDLKPGNKEDSNEGISFNMEEFDTLNIIPHLIEVHDPEYSGDPYQLAIQYIDSGLKALEKDLGRPDAQKARLYEIIGYKS